MMQSSFVNHFYNQYIHSSIIKNKFSSEMCYSVFADLLTFHQDF